MRCLAFLCQWCKKIYLKEEKLQCCTISIYTVSLAVTQEL